MSGKRVIVIRTDTLDRETRATKLINTLTEHGYQVTFLCWDRGIKSSRSEKNEAGIFHREIRLRIKAPWGIKILLLLPVWWGFVFLQLMRERWDMVHVIQVTTLPPALIAARIKGKPVVYDMLDVYEDSISLPQAIRNVCVAIDKFFMKFAGGIILADEAQIEEVGGIPNPALVTIYDSPHTNVQINLVHRKNEVFTIFFGGLLYSGKKLNLDRIYEAVKEVEGVRIVFAGYGDLVGEIRDWSREMPDKIKFIGEISHAQVLEESAKADLLFVLRDPVVRVNRYICGSKILEAMMCGTPMLVNDGTSTAKKVREENCGLVVKADRIEQIRDAIISLRDNPGLCKKLGDNARKAYDERYSWDIMEKRLIDFYEKTIQLG